MDEPDLIDRFYEAAVIPELWPDAIDTAARAADATGAVMFTAAGARSAGVASPALAERFAQFVREGGLRENARLERAIQLGAVGALRDQDMFSPEEIETLPFFQNVRSYGLSWTVAFIQPLPGGDRAVLSLERAVGTEPFGDGAVAMMNRLKPHFARGVLTSARLSLEHAAITLDAFAALGIPAATVHLSKRLQSANGPFNALEGLFLDRRERLALADADADRLLGEALARLRSDLWPGTVGSIPVRGSEAHEPAVLHVMPMRRAAHDIFSGASALVVVSQVGAGRPLAGPLLQALFDLTPGEARVAEAVAQALSPAQIASRLAISESTVRGHLKAAFAKCGVRRQSELVALLNTPIMPAVP